MRRVLIVDDNAVSRELLRHILKGACDEILEASEGREALNKVVEAQPDLVLLDLEMPRLDGYAVLRRLRQDARLASTRVVAVTARAMQGDREQALAAGFDGYITKPINAVEVRRCVEQLPGKPDGAVSGVKTL
jgi:CheY-like chemotaxis protein